jgi:hypothetical protein
MVTVHYEVFGCLSGKFYKHQKDFKSMFFATIYTLWLKHGCALVPPTSIKVEHERRRI